MERLSFQNDQSYSERELAIHLARYLPLADVVPGKVVLDAACGEGYAASIMRNAWGARRVVGVDVSAEAIEAAKHRFPGKQVNFVRADLNRFLASRKATFDVIASVETIEHLADPEETLRLMREALKPSGVIYVTCPNDAWYYGGGDTLNPFHTRAFSWSEFLSMASGVLGAPTRAWIGGIAAGFVTVDAEIAATRSWSTALSRLTQTPSLVGEFLPSSLDPESAHAPTLENALYYCAVWTYDVELPAIAGSAALYPIAPETRWEQLSLVGPVQQRLGGRDIVLVVDPADADSAAHANALSAAAAGKLPISVAAVTAGDCTQLYREVFRNRKPGHVHFFDPRLYASLLTAGSPLAAMAVRSKHGPGVMADILARPVLTFSDLSGRLKDDAAFWERCAPFFDGHGLGDAPYAGAPAFQTAAKLPAALNSGDREARIHFLRSWFLMFRAAHGAAATALRHARAAHLKAMPAQAAGQP